MTILFLSPFQISIFVNNINNRLLIYNQANIRNYNQRAQSNKSIPKGRYINTKNYIKVINKS